MYRTVTPRLPYLMKKIGVSKRVVEGRDSAGRGGGGGPPKGVEKDCFCGDEAF